MGLDHTPSVAAFWRQSTGRSIYPNIQKVMARDRYEQIQRFLKFCDPHTEPEDLAGGKDYWKKLNPLMDDFLDACKKYLILGNNVSVDEQVLKFKGRTKHTMILRGKKARKGFKVYTFY